MAGVWLLWWLTFGPGPDLPAVWWWALAGCLVVDGVVRYWILSRVAR